MNPRNHQHSSKGISIALIFYSGVRPRKQDNAEQRNEGKRYEQELRKFYGIRKPQGLRFIEESFKLFERPRF